MLKWKPVFVLGLWMVVAFASPARAAAPKTLYDWVERSWAVGTFTVGNPLKFRDGRVHVFPSQIDDLLWAPDNTKPRSLMLVYEVPNDEMDDPFYSRDERFLAPILLLPEHSYWRDNLPTTRRHAVAGGRRYAFQGDDIDRVRPVLASYFEARAINGLDRWKGQLEAASSGLGAGVVVLREDSAKYIAGWQHLARDVTEKVSADVTAYLRSDAPVEERALVADAMAAAGISTIEPVLRELAGGEDATSAMALRALGTLGHATPTARLIGLSESGSSEMKAWAGGELGRRASTDEAARERCAALLADPRPDPAVLEATTRGLATGGGDGAATVLGDAVAAGGASSRLAAMALANLGGETATGRLTAILTSSSGEAAIAAAGGLGRVPGCAECAGVLREQQQEHPDERVREMIEVVLEVPAGHKH